MSDETEERLVRAVELEGQRRIALVNGDAAALAQLVRNDAVYVHANGSIVTGREWVSDLASGVFRYESIDVVEQTATATGDCVVLVFALHSAIVLAGEVHHSSTRSTAVWAPFEGDMRLIAYQTTHIQPADE